MFPNGYTYPVGPSQGRPRPILRGCRPPRLSRKGAPIHPAWVGVTVRRLDTRPTVQGGRWEVFWRCSRSLGDRNARAHRARSSRRRLRHGPPFGAGEPRVASGSTPRCCSTKKSPREPSGTVTARTGIFRAVRLRSVRSAPTMRSWICHFRDVERLYAEVRRESVGRVPWDWLGKGPRLLSLHAPSPRCALRSRSWIRRRGSSIA